MFLMLIAAGLSLHLAFKPLYAADNNQSPATIAALKNRQVGPVDPLTATAQYVGNLALNRKLSLTISFQPNNQGAIQALLADLYDPSSSNYHQWLTPEQWADRFGRSSAEVQQVVDWLVGQGFTIEKAWENRLSITFSGATDVVQRAFNVQIGEFQHPAEARTFFANLQRPTLPAAIDAITISLVGLNNAVLRRHPDHRDAQHISPDALIGGGVQYLGPSDLQVVYGYQNLINGGVANQGVGQTIGNIIDSDILNSDLNSLRSQLGLAALGTNGSALNRIVPPGLTNPGTKFEDEAELDVDTMTAAVPYAAIDLIIIDQLSGSSIFTAENYVVNTLKIPAVNESFGGCESGSYNSSEATLFDQAVAEGIAFFASSGDDGVTCFDGSAAGGLGVQIPAAYSGATAVSGTTLQGNFDGSGNVTSVNSDVTWNTPPGRRKDCNGQDTGGGSTGGGTSTIVARPSYQTLYSQPGAVHGVPAGSNRVVPDVALVSDPNGSTLIFAMQGNFFFGGGTSQSSPLMAALTTLVNQFKGSSQGSPNNELYRQGASQYRQ